MRFSTTAVAVLVCAAMLFAASDAQACWSNNATTTWVGDLNGDLHDFGMIFMDTHPDGVSCHSVAATRLKDKLSSMPDTAFDDWLVGGNITLAFAAAMQLGPRGLVTKELDAELARAGRLYEMKLDTINGGCGFSGLDHVGLPKWKRGNTCQEDRLVGAGAYAWIAAYYRKSGRPWTDKKDDAIEQVREAFSNGDSVCRHKPYAAFDADRGPCNGGASDPVVSVNHRAQSPAYGLGQITSLSVALIAFDAMDYPWNNAWLDSGQQSVLASMWTEGSSRAIPTTGVFENECYNVDNWVQPPTNPCNDMHFNPKYEAFMFPVWYAFERYQLPGRTTGGYQWQLSNGTYHLTNRNEFFGAARFAYYHILTKAYNDANEPHYYGWPRPDKFHGGADYYMGFRWNGYWVAAENNGGGAVNANRTAQGPWESFYMNDINGGELNSGDTVTIRTTSGWYWSAVNGGGSYLYANQTTPITWEVFKIEKRGGTGMRIHDGDTFVLKAYNNTHYVNTGGGPLAANGNIVSAAVFTFKHVVDY